MLMPFVLGLSALALQTPPSADGPASSTAAITTGTGDSVGAQAEINLGLAAYRKRRFAVAEQHFNRAMDANPGSAAAAYYLGYVVYKRVELRRNHPDKQRAKELFTKAFTLDPAFRPTWKGI